MLCQPLTMMANNKVSEVTMNKNKLYRTLLASLLGFLPVLALGQEISDHQYSSEMIATGLRVYNQQCALCHGPEGDLVDGIDLSVGQFRNAQSDEDLSQVISSGAAGGRMPAFSLRPEELSGVIAFIRAGFDPDGVAVKIGNPVQGKRLFAGKGQCADCHRVNGVGPYTAPDLTSIGAKRSAASLQRSLIDPATALLPINRPVRLVTRTEETVSGRRLNEDTYTVQLIDSNNQLRSFIKADLVSYEISMQPSKAPTALTSDEVADVVGYLLTLRGL